MNLPSPTLKNGWRVGEIAVIAGLLAQFAALIAWGTRIDGRIGVVEDTLRSRGPYIERLIQTEGNVANHKDALERIEAKIDRLAERFDRYARLPSRPVQ